MAHSRSDLTYFRWAELLSSKRRIIRMLGSNEVQITYNQGSEFGQVGQRDTLPVFAKSLNTSADLNSRCKHLVPVGEDYQSNHARCQIVVIVLRCDSRYYGRGGKRRSATFQERPARKLQFLTGISNLIAEARIARVTYVLTD